MGGKSTCQEERTALCGNSILTIIAKRNEVWQDHTSDCRQSPRQFASGFLLSLNIINTANNVFEKSVYKTKGRYVTFSRTDNL